MNPAAGGGRARRAADGAMRDLRRRGLDPELLVTDAPGHARELAALAASRGTTRLLVCGGDGTLHEVAGALARSPCALGILPSGRGNDLAAVLGISRRASAGLETFVTGTVRQIDLGTVNGRLFCTVAAVGFDAEVARRTRTGWWRHFGGLAYAGGVVGALFDYHACRMRLEGAFGVRDGKYLLAAVSNTGMYGGGVRVAPDSRPDDGLLDCCLVSDLSPLRLLRIFPTAYRGRHVRFPEVEIVRTPTLTVSADSPLPIIADGEPVGETPASFGIAPLALTVVVAGP